MFPNSFFKKTVLFIFSLSAILYYSQKYTITELTEINNKFINDGDLKGALNINFEALNDFKRNNDIEGIITANINIAGLLSNVGKNQESLSYLNDAKKLLPAQKNPMLNAKLYFEYGRCYTSLELYKQSNIQLNKAHWYVKDFSKEYKDIYLYYIYLKKWENFTKLNENDSAYVMRDKNLNVLPSSVMYLEIAKDFVDDKKHLDSVEFYLNKAISIDRMKSAYNKATLFKIKGDLSIIKGENTEGINNYLQYLELSKKMHLKTNVKDAYNKLSELYDMIGDDKKSSEFMRDYKQLNDSIKQEERIAMRIIVNKIDDEKNTEEKESKKKTILLISIICSIITISTLLFYFIRKKHKRRQYKKDQLIERQSKDFNILERKINESFGEVIELAKSNDPFFLTRFKEVYPEFYESLLKVNPKLVPNDIKLAAYIRLDISNKEIATFENLTFRTVETKRYRLKKRLGLESHVDLKEWINNL